MIMMIIAGPVPSRPRATGAFGSRHSRFRWISSHLGGQWASSNFLLLRGGSTSKGFSEPLTERFLYGLIIITACPTD